MSIYYKWTRNANIKTEGMTDEVYQIKSNFMENMTGLQKYCRYICLDLSQNYKENIRPLGFIMSIKELIRIWIIDNKYIT